VDNRESPESELRRVREEITRLRAENSALRRENAMLRAETGFSTVGEHAAVQLHLPDPSSGDPVSNSFSAAEKIGLFGRLFRGRQDVYAVRWEHPDGRVGYAPASRSRSEREHGVFLPLTNEVLEDHLSGRQTIGIYPLLGDGTCWFLAADFDKAHWREDVTAYLAACDMLKVQAALERSRSGMGVMSGFSSTRQFLPFKPATSDVPC
jgi:hypothetical protein